MTSVHWPTQDEINALPQMVGINTPSYFEDRPHLRAHAHHKINWYPWGQAAFDLAKITNKPMFLSIGYASCHWSQRMSDTTFAHLDVAKKLNDHFVAIKIDKDQSPDIDHVYMAAGQLLNHHGAWPNSVFCVPTGQPFYVGSYFPPEDHATGPGFLTLLDQLSSAWAHNQDEILQQAQELERVIIAMNQLQRDPYQSLQLRSGVDACMSRLTQQFDAVHGGFGGAPKFPPYSSLRFLMASSPAMVQKTLDAMALGGLFDDVQGGFYRYSVDVAWQEPHCEKRLMDNAQMIELYALMHDTHPSPHYERVVRDTIHYLLTDWSLPCGGFLSGVGVDIKVKDTSVVLSSNAWFAKALFIASDVFSESSWHERASALIDMVIDRIRLNQHQVYADDVAYALSAVLHRSNDGSDVAYLWGVLMDQFYDYGEGGVWYAQDAHRTPMSRIKDIQDRAVPSPNGVLLNCAFDLYKTTQDVAYYERGVHMMLSFLWSVSQSSEGCHTYWMGVRRYWAFQSPNDYFNVQLAMAQRESDDVVSVQIDLQVMDSYYVDVTSFNGQSAVDYAWLDCQVDPVTSRRMRWSESVVACSSGLVRIRGRCRVSPIPKRLSVAIPMCSNAQALESVPLSLPVGS